MANWLGPLFNAPVQLDLAQSHRGGARVFFVGSYWWGEISRPVSRRFSGQSVKKHARWTFVLVPSFSEGTIVEVYALNQWMQLRGRQYEALSAQPSALESQSSEILRYPVKSGDTLS